MEQPIIFTIENDSEFKRSVKISGMGLPDETRHWSTGDLLFRYMIDGEWVLQPVSVKSRLTNVSFYSILYVFGVHPFKARAITIEASHHLSDLDLEAQMTSDIKLNSIDHFGNRLELCICPRYVNSQINKNLIQTDCEFRLNGLTSMEFIVFPKTKLTVYLYEAID